MLDLIEHLASGVKDVPLLILCLARADLLDERPGVGRRQRARDRRSSWRRCRARTARGSSTRSPRVSRPSCSRRATRRGARDDRGQPALHRGDGAHAARVGRRARRDPAHGAGDDLGPDRPAARAPSERCCGGLPSRADVLVGRDRGPLRQPGSRRAPATTLVERDFLVREPRSTIRGEEAYRFKHVLIRDVAYAGLSKSSRAVLHRQMARLARGPDRGGRARRDPGLPSRRVRPARGGARGPCARRTSRPRRRRRSSRPAGGRSPARRTRSRGGCSSAPSSSRRRSSAATSRPARPGG